MGMLYHAVLVDEERQLFAASRPEGFAAAFNAFDGKLERKCVNNCRRHGPAREPDKVTR
jgi:hypothetical protein